MVNGLLRALVRIVVRRRRWWALGILLTTLAAVWLGSQLTLHLDAEDFLPSLAIEADSVDELVLGRFGASGRIVIVLESEERIDLNDVTQIFDHLAERVLAVPGVQSIDYRLAPELRRFLTRHGPELLFLYLQPHHLEIVASRLTRAGIEAALLGDPSARQSDPSPPLFRVRSDPLGLIGFASWSIGRATGRHRMRLADGYFSVLGGRKFLFTVQPEAGMDDIEKATLLVRGLERVLLEATTDEAVAGPLVGKRLFAVGRPVSYVHGFDTLFGDIRRIAIGAAILVPLLLALFFLRVSAPLVLMLPIVCGIAFSAGAAFLQFGTMSLMAWIFVGVLVGLGVDFGIHIATHYWIYGDSMAARTDAVASAVLRPGRGVVFGALTSAAAFFSIQVASYLAIKQVAWLTGVGILAILVSSLTVLPLALSYSKSTVRKQTLWRRWGALFERATRRPTRFGLLPWAALVVAALVAAPFVNFEPHPWKLALRGNPKSAEMDRLSGELGSSFTPLLMISRGVSRDEVIARDRAATRTLQRVALKAGVASVVSLSNWLPAREDQQANIELIRDNPEIFSVARFNRDFQSVAAELERPDPYLTEEYMPLVSGFMKPEPRLVTLDDLRNLGLTSEIDRHLVAFETEHLAVSYVYLRNFPWAEGAVSRFMSTFAEAGPSEFAGVRILGDALRSSAHAGSLRRDALLATLLALMLVTGILWLQFRSMARSLLCLFPLVCGLSAAGLAMAIFRVELNMLTLTIAPLLVGIGVDDGIHIMERLHAGEPVGNVLSEAGSSMTMTTLTTVAAFACLGLARFEGVREVGLVGSVGLVACLLAALHLVPLCHRLGGSHGTANRDLAAQPWDRR